MMSSLVLDNEAFVALNTLENSWLFDGPSADILPLLFSVLIGFFLGMRCLPSCIPVICELLEERSLEFGGL